MIKIRLLAENYARKRHMLAEHGLSIWIEKDKKRILFDTGQSDIFSLNAEQAGVDISKAELLVLSHGHYDHTGGVAEFCRANHHAPVYIHKDAFQKRYYGKKESNRNIGIPWTENGRYDIDIPDERLVVNKGPVNIDEDIVISGEIPSTVDFEGVPHNFFIDDGNGNLSQDMIIDEQMLLIKGNAGVYVFVGCSHAGIINCIKYAKKLFPDDKIAGVIGGMHLEGVSDIRLQLTIQHFLDMGIHTVIPLHCTGLLPIWEIKRFLKEHCKMLTVGDEFILEE
ncbi:MBL fold metallo-hydrolase [Pseudobacteroides cellulosolvens]|nr:MBL fold metallo-hydrolase [Pseudobacteroides cellulosolvens]